MARIVLQRYPTLNIEGTTYPPPAWRASLAKLVQLLKFSLLAIVITGINPFPSLGFDTPNIMNYAHENKVSKLVINLVCFCLFQQNEYLSF